MDWRGRLVHLAAERTPTAWTLVAAERSRDRLPKCVAAASYDAATASEEMRRLRVQQHLPSEAAVVLWPEPGDAGVAALDVRAGGVVTLPKARVMRERVAPFVRAGGTVSEVLLPHEAVERMVAVAQWAAACVVVLHPTAACIAVVDGTSARASYFSWAPEPAAADAAGRMLGRYQFAARLMPSLREFASQVPSARVVVCGRFPDLRSAMVPIVEDLDREVDVLDAALLGQPVDESIDPADVSGRQLAWAIAAGR